jgi:hypothetical protein
VLSANEKSSKMLEEKGATVAQIKSRLTVVEEELGKLREEETLLTERLMDTVAPECCE